MATRGTGSRWRITATLSMTYVPSIRIPSHQGMIENEVSNTVAHPAVLI